jgi:hypothetical protein
MPMDNALDNFSNPEAIQSYVYALEDPRDKKIFYIGKGIGNRVFAHAKDALKERSKKNEKISLIREIIREELEVKSYIIKYGLSDEEAINYEAIIIETLNKFDHNLTNLVAGHHTEKLFLSTYAVEGMFGLEKIRSLPRNSVILYINDKNFKKGDSIAEIYDAAKQAWVISKDKIDLIEHVIVENKSVVIAMFKNIQWYKVEEGKWFKDKNKFKWGFKGMTFYDMHYMNKQLPPKPNMQTQRRYCLDGKFINGIDLASW